MKNSAHALHYAIAEYGKVLALKNRHDEALEHYREAIRRAVSLKAPEVFFRHYTQCVLESLELTGSYSEVIEFCLKADDHYQTLTVDTPLHRKDHGSVLERCAMIYIRSGDYTSAKACLSDACAVAGKGVLPLSEEVLGYLNRGLSIDSFRLTVLQNKHRYFVVRKGMVDEKNARPLDNGKARKGSGVLLGTPI
ncbi:hypothetical protein M3P05_17325 [Sansalvadorimonas sp. 2012CJ34-2]|uniref:Tetratricopeptide repeat protein n=1 Tax=Parendozoicomonas callyspongiae TaxID=2942213 RepID=A0ABT0PJW9_9GAMM|nr:hypothetical protein [Sansalvadorimonas sp. 2012CJ34-2]MCL6271682.1 hypothetical protein [Sansalvadorimonas sp. 2012CJ34-2]